jgi:hypothetical protein
VGPKRDGGRGRGYGPGTAVQRYRSEVNNMRNKLILSMILVAAAASTGCHLTANNEPARCVKHHQCRHELREAETRSHSRIRSSLCPERRNTARLPAVSMKGMR